MNTRRWVRAAAAVFSPRHSAAAHRRRKSVGYWTSGVSLGFGSTIEQMKFLEKQGLDVEWVKFADVNAPTRAIVSGAIDVAFGASAAGALSIAADGVPVKIFLATQIAEVQFVVLKPLRSRPSPISREKKVGMSPSGARPTRLPSRCWKATTASSLRITPRSPATSRASRNS